MARVHVDRRAVLAALLASTAAGMDIPKRPALAQGTPLPSWYDGEAKQSILNFVSAVMHEGSPDFISVSQRTATFDNDGTLWVEQPMYTQLAFAVERCLAPTLKRKDIVRIDNLPAHKIAGVREAIEARCAGRP